MKKDFVTRCFQSLTAMTLGLVSSTTGLGVASAADMPKGAANFYKSDKVTMQKVTFKNQYHMKVAGNLFIPKGLKPNAKNPAIIVGHPMGAVKEQSANLYATKMAEQGFVTLSLDLSFWGESEGRPRNAVSPDIYAEDFSAAVDFLGTRPFVDRNRIGAIGICGSGSFAISAAKIDPRLKAIATVSMYDMGTAVRSGLRRSQTLEQRKKIIAEAAEQRYAEFSGGKTLYTSGTVHELKDDTHPIQREFFDFYRTPRGEFTPKGSSPDLTTHPTLTSAVKFMNFYPFNDIETISPRPMLFITGENAHSREFSEDAYRLAGEPKELYIVPGAGHVDLYDRVNYIPFDKLTAFFTKNLSPDTESPLVVLGMSPVSEKSFETIKQILLEDAAQSRIEDGVISWELFQPEDGKRDLFAVERYKNRAAFDKHLEAPYVKAFLDNIDAAVRDGEEQAAIFMRDLSPTIAKPIPSPRTTKNIIAVLSVKQESVEPVVTALLDAAKTARNEDGNLVYDVCQDVSNPRRLVVFQRWATPDAYDAHRGQASRKKLDDLLEKSLAQPTREIWRAVRDVGR